MRITTYLTCFDNFVLWILVTASLFTFSRYSLSISELYFPMEGMKRTVVKFDDEQSK